MVVLTLDILEVVPAHNREEDNCPTKEDSRPTMVDSSGNFGSSVTVVVAAHKASAITTVTLAAVIMAVPLRNTIRFYPGLN